MGEIIEYFKDQTSIEVLQRLRLYRNRAIEILSNIEAKERFYESGMGTTITQFSVMKKMTQRSGLVRQKLLQAREQIELTQDYLRGYELLNEIGHAFNGNWKYTVVLSSRGNIYSFELKEEDFIKILEPHLGSYRLISGKTQLLKRLKELKIQAKKWSREEKQGYENYRKALKYSIGIINKGSNNKFKLYAAEYNKGQTLEGYFAFRVKNKNIENYLQSIQERSILAEKNKLGANRYDKLAREVQVIINDIKEQTNSRGFWSGGDTEKEGQIKGEGASAFQFSTIRNQLSKFITIINILNQLDFSTLEYALNKGLKPRAQKNLQKDINETINMIMEQFNATKLGENSQAQLLNQILKITTQIKSFQKQDYSKELSNEIISIIDQTI